MKTITKKLALFIPKDTCLDNYYTACSEAMENDRHYFRVSEYQDVEFTMLESSSDITLLKQAKLDAEEKIKEDRLALMEINRKLTEIIKNEGIRASNV